METKKRGGAITGIALVAIMVVSVMLAMVASTAAYSNSGKYNIIIKQPPAQKVLIGQDLLFSKNVWTTGAPTIYRSVSSDLSNYTFQVKTKPEYACGLDAQSTLRELNIIIKAAVTLTAEPTEAPELTTVKLTVTGVPGTTINVKEDTLSLNAYFPEGLNDNQGPKNNNFNDTIDSDGVRTYAVEFDDTGTYTIKVTDLSDLTGDTYDTVDITVTEKGVTFDVPGTVVIGQRFTIKGAANTGNTVTVAVDDEVVPKLNNIVIDENGEFSEEIDTSSDAAPGAFKIPGSVWLKAYIDYAGGIGTVPAGITDDGSIAILMIRGELTAELSTKSVAKGDEFTITGKAKGSKNVEILIVAPKGFRGSNIETDAKEMYYTSTSVTTTDDSFYKKITVNDDVNSGLYLVMILSAGSDGKWGKSGYDKLYDPNDPINCALCQYTLYSRTQEGMLEIVKDMSALSDDLLWIGLVNVESPYGIVTLNPIAEVNIGEPLEVTGTTNRTEGYTIFVTVRGPTELTPATVTVHNGTFNATLDTSDAKVGVYVVTADDGDGNTDTKQVSIGRAAAQTIFDTGSGTYPSIMGTHNGTIKPSNNITVHKLYTYSCVGTGGHTEFVRIYGNGMDKSASWKGYRDDWHNITFDSTFTLEANKTYDYTIITGSYPQIIHAKSKEVTGGAINCTEFIDANGKIYNDWIPAIKLE
ncbi:MAG: hypothetical protein WAV32_01320 [Halobacteriota archaeon]